jgi:mlo protein
MGTSFKKDIFEEHIQEGLVGWARQAKKNKRKAANGSTTHQGSTISTHHGSSQVDHKETIPLRVQMAEVGGMQSAMEEGNAGEIEHATVSHGRK